jgi:mannose-1-phosphate guanylyltransferase
VFAKAVFFTIFLTFPLFFLYLKDIFDSIIGWNCNVGRWCRIRESVLGEDVKIKDEKYVNGGIVLPHKGINDSITEPKIVM